MAKIRNNLIVVNNGSSGGASLNIEYGLTPPTDTTKLWVQCDTTTSVEIQNYLGECAVSEVLYYCGIENPTTSSYFRDGYFNSCYIGNNQIAIVGYNRIRIFDLSSKSYVANYTISVGTNINYTNILYRDNLLYFGYEKNLYSYDLTTQTLTTLTTMTNHIKYISFTNDNKIDLFLYSNSENYYYTYSIDSGEKTQLYNSYSSAGFCSTIGSNTIKANNNLYNLSLSTSSTNHWIYNTSSLTYTKFTSYYDFMISLGWTTYGSSSVVYDNERYIYLIGGQGTYNDTITYSDLIIRYDIVNDSFEVLEQKLLNPKYTHFNVLVDNKVYLFGGSPWTSNGITYGRKNDMDYFDISYTLEQNKAIITIANYKNDNVLPLINTEALKLNSNISNAYKGNAENKAEKANIYYYDGTTWKGINCSDYIE